MRQPCCGIYVELELIDRAGVRRLQTVVVDQVECIRSYGVATITVGESLLVGTLWYEAHVMTVTALCLRWHGLR